MYESSIASADSDLKSDRINHEVALLMGCTLHEVMMVLMVSFFLSLALSMPPMLLFFDSFTFGLALSLALVLLIAFPLLKKLSYLKQGKPAGYYQQYLRIKLSGMIGLSSSYIRRSGKWSTGRWVQ